MVWLEGNMSLKNPGTPPEINPGTVRLVTQRLSHYATPGPLLREVAVLNENRNGVYIGAEHNTWQQITALLR
jgi:hypothetical protein